jgi:hypothetical protein
MDAIARMRAYRAKLIAAGRLIEARAVAQCINFARQSG